MRLRNEFNELRPTYDVIVIGSGYGASVLAARLQERASQGHANREPHVCVLERGREIESGEFPANLDALRKETQLAACGEHTGSRLGLFDFHVNRDIDVLVGCGLGGTSLINGNISIEPDTRLFDEACWPEEIRAERDSGHLATYFDLARRVLRAVPYPDAMKTPAKLEALKQGAAAAGGTFSKCDLTIHFGPGGINPSGVRQNPCVQCGDCVTGCNFEAKNSLPFTYLPLAKRFGAHIFTQCEVRYVTREGDGYAVHFQRVEQGDDGVEVNGVVRARAVVLGAGVLGSTGILLRSAAAGLALSPRLGERFSGNGDAMTLAYNCEPEMDTIGFGASALAQGERRPDRPTGATLMGVVDKRDRAAPVLTGMIIEEGAFPSGLAKLLGPVHQLMALGGTDTKADLMHWLRKRLREGMDLVGESQDGALNHSLLYLSMGHDGSNGRLSLDDDGGVQVKWPDLAKAPYFERADAATRKLTETLGGVHVTNPLWKNKVAKKLITVHPLGGCAMGSDTTRGVVDHAGRVFDASNPGHVHEGLYVADGSVIPMSLGVNPLLTITALAERTAVHAASDLGYPAGPADGLSPWSYDA